MTENPTPPEETTPPVTPDPPAEAQKPEPSGSDNRVPQARFSEVTRENASLKARLEELEQAEDERKQAAMSDLEKAQEAARVAADKATALEAELAQERQQRLESNRDNMLAQSLASAGAIDADELVLILKAKQTAEVSVLMAEDGTLDSDAIKALVDKTKAERSHNFQAGGVGSPSNRGGQIPAPENESAHRLAAQAAEYGYNVDPKKVAERMQQYTDDE